MVAINANGGACVAVMSPAEATACLSDLLSSASAAFTILDADQQKVLTAGFVTMLVVGDLCGGLRAAEARAQRTAPLRSLSGVTLCAAIDRVTATASQLYKYRQTFAGAIWHIAANGLKARLIAEHFAPSSGDDAVAVAARAQTVGDTILAKLDET